MTRTSSSQDFRRITGGDSVRHGLVGVRPCRRDDVLSFGRRGRFVAKRPWTKHEQLFCHGTAKESDTSSCDTSTVPKRHSKRTKTNNSPYRSSEFGVRPGLVVEVWLIHDTSDRLSANTNSDQNSHVIQQTCTKTTKWMQYFSHNDYRPISPKIGLYCFHLCRFFYVLLFHLVIY